MGTAATQVTGTRQALYSANIDGDLIVSQCGWTALQEAEFGIEAIIAGEVEASRWQATQDGRAVFAVWAAEDERSGEAIYYERQVDGGRRYHGWVDSASRKIVQSG